MATITLEYDGRNTLIKKAIDLVVLAGAKIITPSKATPNPNAKTLKAMREAENGEVIHYKNSEELIQKMYEL